jgi:ribonuclease J
LSARAIPGNEKGIGRVMNHLARRGADVIYEGIKHVHVSGHGSEEELKLMLSLVRPRYFIPIHGEYRQLSQHARVAARVFAGREPRPEILLVENGDLLQFDEKGGRLAGKVPVGRVLIDGTLTGEVADEVLRDRRHLAEDGLVVPVVAINKQTGLLEGVPEIITRGFVMEDGQALLADGARVLTEVMEQSSLEERTDPGLIKEKLRVELRRFLRKRSGRRPFVLPVIMEI